MFYIQENDKPTFLEKMLTKIKIENNRIILPTEKELTEKKQEKLAQKTIKMLNKSSSKKIVVSKKIEEYEKLMNILKSKYINVDGKWLYKMLVPEMMEYILKKENLKKEETSLYILVNDTTDVVLQNMLEFAKEYKTITIITNHLDKFKKIEERILEESGINISIMNNKKKSLSRARIIINFDFPKELINQYVINEKAIILNLPGKLKINKKRYEGKIIQGYEIKLKETKEDQSYNQELEKFYPKAIYESKFYYEQPYQYIRDKIKKDKVEIKELYLQNTVY